MIIQMFRNHTLAREVQLPRLSYKIQIYQNGFTGC